MKKIILIEDRYKRQELFTEELDFEFENYKNILYNVILDDFYHLANEIIHNSFSLPQYDIIICHKSVQIEDKNDSNGIIINRLKEYCKVHQKTLIFFSGGISTNFYDNTEFELLELNSKTFYSKNLSLFLDAVRNQNEDILMLCYGEHWKENIVANTLERTNIFLFDVEHYQVSANDFRIGDNLSKIDYEFYKLQEKSINEIEKFKQSLESYFTFKDIKDTKKQSLVIHHDNICSIELFDKIEKFNTSENIDKYISEMIIDLKEKDFEVLFIKDNLSSNYLELLGLRVAYHIRLSSELGNKRFVPIVIISDFNIEQLCKFDEIANILFTPNTYLCKNTKEDIEKYQLLEFKNLSVKQYTEEFLSKIKINPPKDTSGNHNIANKWSIYKWAKFLDVNSETIDKNKSEIENELYFKYLKAKNSKDMNNTLEIVKPTKKGNVLFIDDEWNKGWSDILKNALKKDGLEFDTFEYDFKDKSNFNLIVQLNHKKLKEQVEKSDVIVLDLRLLESDHENEDIDSYTGIKILEKIHEINAGIQVIMLTATSKSTILEKLYEKKILGYIKKEHPEDKSIDTVENINKFINLVDKGLKRKYLKEVFYIQKSIKYILSNDIFTQYNLDLDSYEPFWIKLEKESTNIFDILDNERENSFIYAMVSISSSLETILSIFVKENKNSDDQFWDNEFFYSEYKSMRSKLNILFNYKLGYENNDIDMEKLIKKRNDYMHSRKLISVNSQEIVSWFAKLLKMIEIIETPPKLKINNTDHLTKLKDKFKN